MKYFDAIYSKLTKRKRKMNAAELLASIKTTNKVTVATHVFEPSVCKIIFDSLNIKNRKFKQKHGDKLAQVMGNGMWQTNGESIKFDQNGNLIDGQHRVYASWKSGVPLETVVVYGLSPKTQNTIDVGAKRNVSDVLNLNGVTNGSKIGSVANWCLRYENKVIGSKVAGYEHVEVLDWLSRNPDVQPIFNFVSGLNPQKNCGVSEAMLAAFVIEAKKAGKYNEAIEFVTQYSTGVGIQLNSGIHRFSNFVKVNNRPHNRPRAEIYFAALIRCFNDFVDGKVIKRTFSVNDVANRISRNGFPSI